MKPDIQKATFAQQHHSSFRPDQADLCVGKLLNL